VRKIIARLTATLAVVLLALGLTAGAAQAQPLGIEIGPVTVCHVVTFFDNVIFEYDCHTEG
jgi:ABC-type sugar transport system substrate-binding protein